MLEVDDITQGSCDYLRAEISINGQIICLIGIGDDLDIFIEFFHERRMIDERMLTIQLSEFLDIVEECREKLLSIVDKLKKEP